MEQAPRRRRFKTLRSYIAGRRAERDYQRQQRMRIRAEEQERAERLAQREKIKKVRRSERQRAEVKSGLRDPAILGGGWYESNSPKRTKRPKKSRTKPETREPPKVLRDPFFGSGADSIIFGESRTDPKRKKKDHFEDFKKFEEIL